VIAGAWQDQRVLEGNHVLLRPMARADGPAIVEAASDGRLWELFYTSVPSAESIDGYLNIAEAERSYGRAMPYVVIDKASERLVGSTRFMRMKAEARRLEIGTTFYAESVQRSPINTEAKLLLLSQAFEAMDCLCVQIRTDSFNIRSQRAIERLGAKRDGVLRNHGAIAGRTRDVVVYSIIATEWEGVKRNLQMRLARG
jgi:N-acetyltransferase